MSKLEEDYIMGRRIILKPMGRHYGKHLKIGAVTECKSLALLCCINIQQHNLGIQQQIQVHNNTSGIDH
jgi:hypothetical protein